MLESLVIEMSQEYLREFEGEMKDELRDFCMDKIETEVGEFEIDHREIARHLDAEYVAEYICSQEVADNISSYDIAEHVNVEAGDVAEHVDIQEIAEHVNVEELVADEIRAHLKMFDWNLEIETAVGRGLDYDHIAEEVASRISIESTVIV